MSTPNPYGPIGWPLEGYFDGSVRSTTYDDPITVIEQLAHLRDATVKLLKRLKGQDERVDALLSEYETKFTQAIADLTARWDVYRSDIEYLIESLQDSSRAWNPVRGTRHGSVDDAIDDVYDNVRVHAWFVSDYEALDMTAAEYEALELTARQFDLDPTRVTEFPTVADNGA